ncbi:hypothetical protein J4U00_gp136 [Mycobacterium phage DyoEdafos]|uniref:Uncharacterized protein n=1 Tax=Mycobacterium phage DyoEdafos TaxID=2599860 RepID=A0A5J6TI03_9CAUD|nr:hypothetical protein J4U00_gp136 [Mycobacterium phage DyoEdafos]QFG10345.1 hypothetical protein SEA_DYOEDAFOS_131 [Mycobacterium phage DyoEdafos]
MSKNDPDDIEPGWAGLGRFLWPIAVYAKIKGWLMDKGLIRRKWKVVGIREATDAEIAEYKRLHGE